MRRNPQREWVLARIKLVSFFSYESHDSPTPPPLSGLKCNACTLPAAITKEKTKSNMDVAVAGFMVGCLYLYGHKN